MFKIKHVFTVLIVFGVLCFAVFYLLDGSKRIVHIKVVADKEFRFYYGREKFIRDVVKEASKQFDNQLGIKLKIKKIDDVETEGGVDRTFLKMEEAAFFLIGMSNHICNTVKLRLDVDWVAEHIDPEDCDIVVCFSGETYGNVLGMADRISGRYTLISYSKEDSFQKILHVFVHEVGHLFGAVHFYQENSVMCPGATSSLEFDQINKILVLRSKWRNFEKQSEEF